MSKGKPKRPPELVKQPGSVVPRQSEIPAQQLQSARTSSSATGEQEHDFRKLILGLLKDHPKAQGFVLGILATFAAVVATAGGMVWFYERIRIPALQDRIESSNHMVVKSGRGTGQTAAYVDPLQPAFFFKVGGEGEDHIRGAVGIESGATNTDGRAGLIVIDGKAGDMAFRLDHGGESFVWGDSRGGNMIGRLSQNGFVTKGIGRFSNGIASQRSNLQADHLLPVASSPFTWTNTSDVNVTVTIGGGVVTSIDRNGASLGKDLQLSGITPIGLQPREFLQVYFSQSSSPPTIVWKPQ